MNTRSNDLRSTPLLVTLLLLLVGAGCAVPAGGAGDIDKGVGGSSYYRQFITEPNWESGTYPDGLPRFTRIASTDEVTIETAEGERRKARATFFLVANGDAYVDYSELGPEEDFGGGVIGRSVVASALLLTSWDVDGDRIVIEGVGEGRPLTYNDEDAIGFSFTHDLVSAGLDGRGAIVRRGNTSQPLERVEAEYECGGECE